MINPLHTKKSIGLFAALVLMAFATVLVAQNNPSSKETAPAGSGLEKNQSTEILNRNIYSGSEYLIYRKNDQIMMLDPSTGEESPSQNREESYYNGNLGTWIPTLQKKVSIPSLQGGPDEIITDDLIGENQSPVNGNVITYDYSKDFSTPYITIHSDGLQDYVLKEEILMTQYSEVTKVPRLPFGWIDKSHLLVLRGEPDAPFEGIMIIDIASGEEKIIVEAETYLFPAFSPSGRYIAFSRPNGKFNTEDYGPTSAYLYDLRTNKITKLADPGSVYGWTTKKIAQNPVDTGFFNRSLVCATDCNALHCLYTPNTIIFKLPYPCGEAYWIIRDGACSSPATCNLGPGSYPTATWLTTLLSCAHDNKVAIDFNDNYIGGNGNDHLPVLASASGTVVRAGWENTSNHAAGLGQRVWIKHDDGTFTAYGHLKEGSIIVSEGSHVDQGAQLGLEGCTGSCSGEHIHFERRTASAGNNNLPSPNAWDSYWMEFSELGSGKIPTSNHIYISKNGNCSDCGSIILIPACGHNFSNQSNVGLPNNKATYFVNMPGAQSGYGGPVSNNASSLNYSGPEKAYYIATSLAGTISVTLTSNSNLTPFILKSGGNCSLTDPLLHCQGTSLGLTAYTGVVPAGGYFIFVDGKNGASGSFTINITTSTCQNLANLTDNASTKTTSGRNVTITTRVRNEGSVAAGTFKTRHYLINTSSGIEYVLGTLLYSGLSAGNVSEFVYTWTAPSNAPAGTYKVLEKIDYLFNVSESNENDNNWYIGSNFYLPPSNSQDRSIDKMGIIEVPGPNETNEFNITENDQNTLAPNYQSESVINSSNVIQTTCNATANGYAIVSSPVDPESTYILFNSLGMVICQGKASNGSIECSVATAGIYFLSIVDGVRNMCVQKIFVN